MSLTQEKIASLKKLTALNQGESLNIDGVLDSFQSLQSLEIPRESEISRSGNDLLQPRQDRVMSSTSSSEALLACSPQRVVAHQISLGSIMHGE